MSTHRQPEGVKKALRGGVDPAVGKHTQIKKGERRNPDGKNGQDFISRVFKEVFQDEAFIRTEVRKILKGKSAMAKVMLIEHAAERLEGKVSQPVKVDGELKITLAAAIQRARERASKK
jgi:hypothetical protein